MKNTVVVGAQWGDEGKAKITDLLSSKADMIIRYQGGCNAGHTVVADGNTYKFHLIPSGILYKGKTCFIGAGVVIYPEIFQQEIQNLLSNGIDLSNLKISPLAHITMPYHIELDGINEKTAGKNKIGTTKKGIGPTYTDKYSRHGIRVEDLFSDEILNYKIDLILDYKNRELESYNCAKYTKNDLKKICKNYAEILSPYVDWNWQETLKSSKNKKILFEGAQGIMLDVDYGTYPYVTSSNPIAGGACVGSGFGPKMIYDVIGVSKAYITRVGEGPFVTELTNDIGEKIREIGREFGTTTGRARRCGWFDGVVAKYGILVGGLTSMAITKLDVFNDFEEILICNSYRDKRNGKVVSDYPTCALEHKYYEPVYETHKGWMCDISNCKTFDELPKNAKKYLKRLEEIFEIPIKIISVGPDREQTIFI